MVKANKDGKPRGKMSAYAFFVQTCREEHKKKHPGEQVVFAEFSKKCAEKWKSMGPKEKKRFDEMAEKDKGRFEREMSKYTPPPGEKKRRRKTKDPNAPKRALSAFFFFCNEERGNVKAGHPEWGVGDIAKELGKKWEVCPNKPKFEALAASDKKRYEQDMINFRKGNFKKVKTEEKPAPVKKVAAAAADDDDDDDDDDEEEEEDDEEDEDDD